MSLNEAIVFANESPIFTTHTSKQHRLGQLAMLSDGRKFRYAYATAIQQGIGRASINANNAPGSDTNVNGYEGALSAATPAGAVELTFPDTTARVADFYESGYVIFYNDTTSHYWTQRIRSSGISAGTTVTIQLECETPFDVSASHQVSVMRSPFSNIKNAMAINQEYEPFMGIAQAYVAASRWFWLQTAGPCLAAPHGGTWPGSAAHYRDVFFWMDGTIDPASVADPTSGYQRAGYLLSGTRSSYGDNFIMLQLE
jgi:hypothetical protein